MTLEDIVQDLNTHIDHLRINNGICYTGYFAILRKSSAPSTFTKAIKQFDIALIYINNKGKNNITLFAETATDKIISDPQEFKLVTSLEHRMVRNIMYFLQDTETFNKILNNELDTFK